MSSDTYTISGRFLLHESPPDGGKGSIRVLFPPEIRPAGPIHADTPAHLPNDSAAAVILLSIPSLSVFCAYTVYM